MVAGLGIVPLTATSPASALSTTCSGAPVKGGSLVYARQAGPVTLNPFFPTNGNGDIFADTLLYQGLVHMPDPTGKTQNIVPSPWRAGWTEASNGMSYTFHIRPGIKFSNGSPVTAADVVFSLNYFANPKSGREDRRYCPVVSRARPRSTVRRY